MTDQKPLILFLSEGGNNLNIMAESFARKAINDDVDFISASLSPAKLNLHADKIMRESGIDISKLPLYSLVDIELVQFDLVVTIGDFNYTYCPAFPGNPPHLHWDVPVPNKSNGDYVSTLKHARDQIQTSIINLFSSELLHVLFYTRRNLELILDNLPDGIMAHTRQRKIFFFNKAAEEMTGYKREEVLGKDCHDVLPGRFCGGNCDYCESTTVKEKKIINKKRISFRRPDGEERILNMTILPLAEEGGNHVGALLSFKDDTELNMLKHRLKHRHSLGSLVGRDPKTIELFDQIKEVSSVLVPILIEGESGTGKELVANAIHDTGPRALKPFVAINCGALPEGILESELFGHVRGAFSGAEQNRKGRFELAHGGTLFLDEVGELSPAMQVKLLRVLQEQSFERVGGERSIKVNVRIISATNQNLRQLMEEKKFRRDLFYRLCVFPIKTTPLRERKLDIPALIEHFMEITATEHNRPILVPSNDVIDLLSSYSWPGNVRELRNAIEYAYVKCRSGVINVKHIPPEIRQFKEKEISKPGPPLKLKKDQILVALSKSKGNRKEAAKLLGVSRATLYRYLNFYELK